MNRVRWAVLALALAGSVIGVAASRGVAATSVGPVTVKLSGTASVTGTSWSAQKIAVAGPGTISVALSWPDPATDLNLFLKNPDGLVVAESRAHTGTTEALTFDAQVAGTWKIGVKAVKGGSPYDLTVTYPGTIVTPDPTTTTPTTDPGTTTTDPGTTTTDPGTTTTDPGTTTTDPGTTTSSGGGGGTSSGGTTSSGGGTGGTTSGVLDLWAAKFMNGSQSVTLDQAVSEAKRFNIISATRTVYRPYVAQMKAANPNLKLLVYLNGTYAQQNQGSAFPDAWYSHTAGGAKITSGAYGNYLMNPASQGWIDTVVQTCIQFKADSGYDGCLLDMLGTGPLMPGYDTGLPVNPATGSVWTDSQWLAATSHLAATVRSAIAPAVLAGNGIQNGNSYFRSGAPSSQLFNGVDIGMAETWIRAAHQGISSWPTEANWKSNVDTIANAGAHGNSIVAITKCWATGTDAQKEQWHRFALASFLLGNDGHSDFYFSYSASNDAASDNAMWHVALGQPLGAYANVGGVYLRDFAAGKVLVNPTAASVFIPLGGAYVDLDGNLVTSITLAPHTGQILTI
jgi:Hypothetical glycosyl hydrolase family 15